MRSPDTESERVMGLFTRKKNKQEIRTPNVPLDRAVAACLNSADDALIRTGNFEVRGSGGKCTVSIRDTDGLVELIAYHMGSLSARFGDCKVTSAVNAMTPVPSLSIALNPSREYARDFKPSNTYFENADELRSWMANEGRQAVIFNAAIFVSKS